MRGNEFLDKMELIDPVYIEAADKAPKRKKVSWKQWSAVAACLCIVLWGVMLFRFGDSPTNPQLGEIVLSDKTTAEVTYGYDGPPTFSESSLVYFSEEKMFAREDMYIFRGKVSDLANITIDFNGEKEPRCIALIVIEEVYKGDLAVGDTIRMLLPCVIGLEGIGESPTKVIRQIESGMEGIFMPWVYDEESYMEQNGAVLMLEDIAECGLADGMRWAFLFTKRGLVYDKNAYPGAKDAENLKDIEKYVIEMLK